MANDSNGDDDDVDGGGDEGEEGDEGDLDLELPVISYKSERFVKLTASETSV